MLLSVLTAGALTDKFTSYIMINDYGFRCEN